MANNFILNRLDGIQEMLIAVHRAGADLSSAAKGTEREIFLNSFLSKILPSPFRFGSGDITDQNGRKSGQLDIVIEYSLFPSLPLQGTPRLYLAEGVAAVIEVKSNVCAKWNEVLNTVKQLSPLRRNFTSIWGRNVPSCEKIPFFAVGYTGWKKWETVYNRLCDSNVDGILIIDSGIFVSNFIGGSNPIIMKGYSAIWGLISCIHKATTELISAEADLLKYAEGCEFCAFTQRSR